MFGQPCPGSSPRGLHLDVPRHHPRRCPGAAHGVTGGQDDTEWKGSCTGSLWGRVGPLAGCGLVLLGPAWAGAPTSHPPREERTWSRPPGYGASHNLCKLLSFCPYGFISPTTCPESSVRPPQTNKHNNATSLALPLPGSPT